MLGEASALAVLAVMTATIDLGWMWQGVVLSPCMYYMI